MLKCFTFFENKKISSNTYLKEIKAPGEVVSSLERTHSSKTHEIFFFPDWF
jgi:hypothetical protein